MHIATLSELNNLIQQKLGNRKPLVLDPPKFTHAAVLIPIISEEDQLKVILTKRTETLKHHRGEISFPGGKSSKEDNNLVETALRETDEEIGVKGDQVQVVSRLDDLFTITRYIITPFIGLIRGEIELVSNDAEVAEILHVPLKLFLTQEKFAEKAWERNGVKYPLYYYYWKNYEIWGATAYIINQFTELIFEFQPSLINFKRENPDLIKDFMS